VQIRIDGAPAGAVLSRGQGKLVASALQIGQASLLAESERRSTVFLIDDAGAELDLAHNARFFGLLERLGGQILATTTRRPGLDQDSTQGVFHVERGTVTPDR
jgi:DNA replication and repair protein RecF